MRRFAAMIIVALILTVTLSSSLPALEKPVFFQIPLITDNQVTDSIPCFRRGETYYSSVEQLVEAMVGSTDSDRSTLTLSFPGKSVTLTVGSPFASLADGSVWQLLMPVEAIQGNYISETLSIVKLLNSISRSELSFDSEKRSFTLKPFSPPPQSKDDRSRWALDLVIIDPGHGGKDPGAIGFGGLKEKDVTLDVAQRLNKFLKSKNIKTVMTRDSDEFIALSERTSIANNAKGKLFISLHCNSAKQRKAHGMETYFLAPSKTERATQVALLENEAIRFEDEQNRYKELTEESYILMTMTQATFTGESEDLAGTIQETLTKKIGLNDRGVDQAGFYVLIGASMPAILFEMAFISNKDEEKKLKDKKFRQKVAEELGGAILNFLAEQEKAPGH